MCGKKFALVALTLQLGGDSAVTTAFDIDSLAWHIALITVEIMTLAIGHIGGLASGHLYIEQRGE